MFSKNAKLVLNLVSQMTIASLLLVLTIPISSADHLPAGASDSEHSSIVTEVTLNEDVEIVNTAVETASIDDEVEPTYPRTETFLVSAYYSPLPNQKRYATGSYAKDIRLNGNGTHGASGRAVNIFMLAAPPEYAFGTKITCPGLGTGSVQDRGGAIKNRRLDKWMGYGDIGLKRALQWGKRSVTCINHGIDNTIAETSYIDDFSEAEKFIQGIIKTPQVFAEDLWYQSTGHDVELLKNHLTELGYYQGVINDKYDDSLTNAIFEFQKTYKIIADKSELGAGNFGPQTRAKLQAVLEKRKKEDLPQKSLKLGDTGQDVTKLQHTLNKLGYGIKVTGIFDEQTQEALGRYQLDHGLNQEDVNVSFNGVTLASLTHSVISQVTIREEVESTRVVNTVVLQEQDLGFGDSGPAVYKLQEELTTLNYLHIAPNGQYTKFTQHAVFKFQQANSIVENMDFEGAGVFGTETRATLNSIVSSRVGVQRMIAQKNNSPVPVLLAFGSDLSVGDQTDEVKALQVALKELDYFNYQYITDFYGEVTKSAVLAFQMDNDIVSGASAQGAGVFGPQTRLKLSELIAG